MSDSKPSDWPTTDKFQREAKESQKSHVIEMHGAFKPRPLPIKTRRPLLSRLIRWLLWRNP